MIHRQGVSPTVWLSWSVCACVRVFVLLATMDSDLCPFPSPLFSAAIPINPTATTPCLRAAPAALRERTQTLPSRSVLLNLPDIVSIHRKPHCGTPVNTGRKHNAIDLDVGLVFTRHTKEQKFLGLLLAYCAREKSSRCASNLA